MATLYLVPESKRDAFIAPNGTYYAVRWPDLETAQELVSLGVHRIVLPETHMGVHLREDIANLLFDADIEIVYRQSA